jgi:hypothetical protein
MRQPRLTAELGRGVAASAPLPCSRAATGRRARAPAFAWFRHSELCAPPREPERPGGEPPRATSERGPRSDAHARCSSGAGGRGAPCLPRQAGAPSADGRFSFDYGSGSACRRACTARRSTMSPRTIGMRLSRSAGVDPGACAASPRARSESSAGRADTTPTLDRHVGTRPRRRAQAHDPGRWDDCRRRASAARERMPSLR